MYRTNVDKEEEHLWLSKDISVQELLTLCDAYPDKYMNSFRVSTAVNATVVNKTPNNKPELLLPIAADSLLF